MPSHQIGSFKSTLKYLLNRFPVPVPKKVGRSWWLSHPLQLRWKTEAHILSWAEQVLRKGDTVIDVGAHAGWIRLASSGIVGSTGNVVAIEPSPALASLIRYHRTVNLASSSSLKSSPPRIRAELQISSFIIGASAPSTRCLGLPSLGRRLQPPRLSESASTRAAWMIIVNSIN